MSGDWDLTMRDRLATAREQGAKDRRAGLDIHDCPYERVSFVEAWEAGWREAPAVDALHDAGIDYVRGEDWGLSGQQIVVMRDDVERLLRERTEAAGAVTDEEAARLATIADDRRDCGDFWGESIIRGVLASRHKAAGGATVTDDGDVELPTVPCPWCHRHFHAAAWGQHYNTRHEMQGVEFVPFDVIERWYNSTDTDEQALTLPDIVRRFLRGDSVSQTAGQRAPVIPADLLHGAERALEWAAKYPLGGGMDQEVANRVYHLLSPLVDPSTGKYALAARVSSRDGERDATTAVDSPARRATGGTE